MVKAILDSEQMQSEDSMDGLPSPLSRLVYQEDNRTWSV